MHGGILKGDRLEFRLFQLLRVIRQFRFIGRRDGANHVARQLCPQRRELIANFRISHVVQGESLPQTAVFVFANDGHDKIAGISIERMGLRQFGGILRADRQTNTNRPVKFRQLNQLTGVLGCVQSFQCTSLSFLR